MAGHTRNHLQVQVTLSPAILGKLNDRVAAERATGRRSSRSAVVAHLVGTPASPRNSEVEQRAVAIIKAAESLRRTVAHRAGVEAINQIVAEAWALRRK